ncbi:hypothetical protein BDF21DRAFT_426415 [Thamnidium elegans]|nr:hypothetical protein BDF21DRAFT_426415 [Thamnidium elegans]
MRGERGNVCITSGYETSQACIYCFEPLEHRNLFTKIITKGSLMCINPSDALSSLVIGLSGLNSSVTGMSIPHFSQSIFRQYETEDFKNQASTLLTVEENSQLQCN